jgi:hypothetical protein
MRFALLLFPVVLFSGCATQPPPVPDTWPARYRSFLQESKLPLGFRMKRYLGSIQDESSLQVGTQEAIVVRFGLTNPISSVTIRFDESRDGGYVGNMWTNFNRNILCVSLKQLSEVGDYMAGDPILVHGHGPNGFFGVIRMDRTPDKFILALDDGAKIEGVARFERGCLSQLEHPVASRSTR